MYQIYFELYIVLELGRYRRHEEEEPEWFSSGPTSQSDTIELRGFEEPKREKEQEPSHEEEYMEEENEQRGEVEEEPHTETKERKEDQKAQVTGGLSSVAFQ